MPITHVVSLDGSMAGSMARLDGGLDGASMAPRWLNAGAQATARYVPTPVAGEGRGELCYPLIARKRPEPGLTS